MIFPQPASEYAIWHTQQGLGHSVYQELCTVGLPYISQDAVYYFSWGTKALLRCHLAFLCKNKVSDVRRVMVYFIVYYIREHFTPKVFQHEARQRQCNGHGEVRSEVCHSCLSFE